MLAPIKKINRGTSCLSRSDPRSVRPQNQPDYVIMHIYTAAAMEHLAGTLPKDMDGLAHLIGKLGKDVEFCAILLDDPPGTAPA